MRSARRVLLALFFIITIVACQRNANETPVADTSPESPATQPAAAAPAAIQQIELIVSDSFPVSMQVRFRGDLPDGCTTLAPVTPYRDGNRFVVEVMTERDDDAMCTLALVPFDETVALDVEALPAGQYVVDVNGVTQAFILDADNVVPPTPTPAPSPTPEPTPTATPVPFATIGGFVWNDRCTVVNGVAAADCLTRDDGALAANGTLDPDEPILSGVLVRLNAGACPGSEALANIATDINGEFRFDQLQAGSYCLTIDETDPANADILSDGFWQSESSVTVEVGENEEVTLAFGWEAAEPIQEFVEDPNCIDLATFGSDVTIPDDTPIEAGTAFDKTWRIVNIGGCLWTPEYSLVFVDGERMDAPAAQPLPGEVRPGEGVNITVTFIAPSETGTYRSDWLLQDPEGNLLGMDGLVEESVWVQIEAVEAGSLASVSGAVWEDVCDPRGYNGTDLPPGCFLNDNGTLRANSIWETEESGISGVVMVLGAGECGDATALRTVTTDADGAYRFANVNPGTYCVYIDVFDPVNFNNLLPGAFTFPEPNRAGQTITLEAGDALEGIDFGWDRTEAQ